jgi:hypothetical protein
MFGAKLNVLEAKIVKICKHKQLLQPEEPKLQNYFKCIILWFGKGSIETRLVETSFKIIASWYFVIVITLVNNPKYMI